MAAACRRMLGHSLGQDCRIVVGGTLDALEAAQAANLALGARTADFVCSSGTASDMSACREHRRVLRQQTGSDRRRMIYQQGSTL